MKKFGFFRFRIMKIFEFFVKIDINTFSRFSGFEIYRCSKIFVNIIFIFKYIFFVLEITGPNAHHCKYSKLVYIT